jgi:hypothetical protein
MDAEKSIAAELEQLKKQQALIIYAVRISLSLILLTLAVTCVQAALRIPTMSDILRDMLPGTALPWVTQFVMGHAGLLLLAAILLPALGIGLLVFSRGPGRGIVAATVVIVVLFVQWQIVVSAMQLPLTQLMSQIGEPPK